METKLVDGDIWPKITAAAKRSKGYVAVAYLGRGATKLLPLRAGSTLVVNFSDRAVRSGETCPAEVIRLLNKGVSVFTVSNLHAKVFVFGDRAFIGSTNVSRSSAEQWVEAAVETKNRVLMKAMRAFVQDHAAEPVTLHYAQLQAKKYRPPQSGLGGKRAIYNHGSLPIHSPVRVVQLELTSYTAEEQEARKVGLPIARKRLRNTKTSKVDDFRWTGHCSFGRDDMLIQVTDVGRKRRVVSPAARVLSCRRVPTKRGQCHIVFLETPKKCRRIEIGRLRERVGKKAWEVLQGDHQVRDKYVAHVLLRECGGNNRPRR